MPPCRRVTSSLPHPADVCPAPRSSLPARRPSCSLAVLDLAAVAGSALPLKLAVTSATLQQPAVAVAGAAPALELAARDWGSLVPGSSGGGWSASPRELAAASVALPTPMSLDAMKPCGRKQKASDGLTDYEKLRAKNMKRNNQVFQSLGIGSGEVWKALVDLWPTPNHKVANVPVVVFPSLQDEVQKQGAALLRDELDELKKMMAMAREMGEGIVGD